MVVTNVYYTKQKVKVGNVYAADNNKDQEYYVLRITDGKRFLYKYSTAKDQPNRATYEQQHEVSVNLKDDPISQKKELSDKFKTLYVLHNENIETLKCIDIREEMVGQKRTRKQTKYIFTPSAAGDVRLFYSEPKIHVVAYDALGFKEFKSKNPYKGIVSTTTREQLRRDADQDAKTYQNARVERDKKFDLNAIEPLLRGSNLGKFMLAWHKEKRKFIEGTFFDTKFYQKLTELFPYESGPYPKNNTDQSYTSPCTQWKSCLYKILPLNLYRLDKRVVEVILSILYKQMPEITDEQKRTLLSEMSIAFAKYFKTDKNIQAKQLMVYKIMRSYFYLSTDEMDNANDKILSKMTKRLSNLQPLNTYTMHNYIRTHIRKKYKDADIPNLLNALLISCGCRFNELVSHLKSDFDAAPVSGYDQRVGWLQQTGRSKSRDSATRLNERLFVITKPLVSMTVIEFLHAVDYIRGHKDVIDICGIDPNRQPDTPRTPQEQEQHLVNKDSVLKERYTEGNPDFKTWDQIQTSNEGLKKLNFYKISLDITKDLYKKYWDFLRRDNQKAQLGVHINRSAYVTLSYHIHDVGPKSLIYWTKEVLGHKSLDTAKSYQIFKIEQKLDKVDKTIASKIEAVDVRITNDVKRMGTTNKDLENKVSTINDKIEYIKSHGIVIQNHTKKNDPKPTANFNARSYSTTVVLRDRTGQPVILTKVPNHRYRRKKFTNQNFIINAHLDRVNEAITRLKNANVPANRNNVRSMGLSSDTIKMFINQNFLHKAGIHSFNAAMRDKSNGVQVNRGTTIAPKKVVNIDGRYVVSEIKTKHDNRYTLAQEKYMHIKQMKSKFIDDYSAKLEKRGLSKKDRDIMVKRETIRLNTRLETQNRRVKGISQQRNVARVKNTKAVMRKNNLDINKKNSKKIGLTSKEFNYLEYAI